MHKLLMTFLAGLLMSLVSVPAAAGSGTYGRQCPWPQFACNEKRRECSKPYVYYEGPLIRCYVRRVHRDVTPQRVVKRTPEAPRIAATKPPVATPVLPAQKVAKPDCPPGKKGIDCENLAPVNEEDCPTVTLDEEDWKYVVKFLQGCWHVGIPGTKFRSRDFKSRTGKWCNVPAIRGHEYEMTGKYTGMTYRFVEKPQAKN